MEYILKLVLFFLTIAEYTCFFIFVFGRKIEKKYNTTNVLLLIILYFFSGIVVYNSDCSLVIIMGLFASFITIYTLMNFEFKQKLGLFILAMPILSIIESLIQFIVHLCRIKNEIQVSIIYVSVILIIMSIYYLIIGKKTDKNAFIMPMHLNIIWAIVLNVMIAMISFFTYVITEYVDNSKGSIGIFLVMTGGLIIFVMSLYFIYDFNVKQMYKIDNELLEKYNEQQKEYFSALLEKEKATRNFRHDTNAQLVQIRQYLKKNDFESLELFVNDMLKDIESIRGYDYDVGNEIINTMLNYYFIPLKNECDIVVKGYVKEDLTIMKRELCIIISNLLKNVVEAINKITDDDKKIIFEIKSNGSFLLIKLINTVRKDNEIIIKNNQIMTDKKDKHNHGFGVLNIVNTIKKNEGAIDMYIDDDKFISKITLGL
ncbi:GHKL domain-containing protein [Lachnospiraceae bacterium RM5]|nr:GHKL domain-containing protein [Lachnospiraceae bacterium RM5]